MRNLRKRFETLQLNPLEACLRLDIKDKRTLDGYLGGTPIRNRGACRKLIKLNDFINEKAQAAEQPDLVLSFEDACPDEAAMLYGEPAGALQ